MKSCLLRKFTLASSSNDVSPTHRKRSRLAIITKWICISRRARDSPIHFLGPPRKREHRPLVTAPGLLLREPVRIEQVGIFPNAWMALNHIRRDINFRSSGNKILAKAIILQSLPCHKPTGRI